ncbi:type II toxin-antitoxin system VapC family toxin [Candidatus Poriferisodalis sp.]|uniref:type II toxin-antitoxin system VapC family toxin n=1 Tax=Candidatus Poriferisodalis sp. TaxID=3101277 RepID=UPI003C6EE796
MTSVLDASAILARLRREPGADNVERALISGACCGAANWSEVSQKIRTYGLSPAQARGLLDAYGFRIEPVTVGDAEWAAHRWRPRENLSLADRLCLALGERLDAQILTADRSWGDSDSVTQIR